jgi:uncharacterized protein YoxC
MIIYILLSGLVILSLCFFALCFFALRMQQHVRSLQDQIKSLDRNLEVLTQGELGLGKHMNTIAMEVNKIQEKQMMNSSNYEHDKSYEHASHLLAKGASSSELVEFCELNEQEAQLLKRIYDKQQARQKSAI